MPRTLAPKITSLCSSTIIRHHRHDKRPYRLVPFPYDETVLRGVAMGLELYWGSGSPFAWRVMLTLEVKRLSYESKLLEFSKSEHKTPSFLRLNPRGKIPVLKDGDLVLYESLAIMAYLEKK